MGKLGVREFDNFTGLDLRSGNETTPPEAALSAVNVYLTTGSDYLTRPPLSKVADLDAASRGLYVVGDILRSACEWRNDAVPLDVPGVLRYDLLRGPNLANVNTTLADVVDVASWKGRPYINALESNAANGDNFAHHFPGALPNPVFVTLTNGSTSVPGLPAPLDAATGYPVRFVGVGTGYTATYRVTGAGVITPAWPGATSAAGAVEAVLFDIADTVVALPFEPGPAVRAAAEKVFATASDNTVPFSATGNPLDWTTLDDAGFLPTNTHIEGDQPISGLGVFKGQLLVMAKRAMQVWNIDPDPAQMSLAANIGGSGCDFPRSVANIGGDVILFATGQFRTVSAIVTTGQPKDGDIGAMIRSATRSITRDNSTYEMVAVWWAELQCYVAFQGSTAYVLVHSPAMQVQGWTTWTMPFPVKNAAVWNGKLYVRRADISELWVMDPDSTDYTREPVAFAGSVRWAWNTLDDSRRMKLLRQMIVPQEGESNLRVYYVPGHDESYEDFGTITGSTTGHGRLLLSSMTDIASVEFSFTGYWRLGAFSIYYEAGNLQ